MIGQINPQFFFSEGFLFLHLFCLKVINTASSDIFNYVVSLTLSQAGPPVISSFAGFHKNPHTWNFWVEKILQKYWKWQRAGLMLLYKSFILNFTWNLCSSFPPSRIFITYSFGFFLCVIQKIFLFLPGLFPANPQT